MLERIPRRSFLLGGVAAFLAGCANKFRSYNGPEVTRVRLYKSERLLVLDGAQGVLKTYPVGLGFAPEGHKQFEGDGRTPEGAYTIDRRNPDSLFHLSVGISYPNDADVAFAEAQGKSPGGDIFIHGGPRKGIDSMNKQDWTYLSKLRQFTKTSAGLLSRIGRNNRKFDF